jgi:hypothetical protein
VFSYGLGGGALGGQALVEMIEETYVAFRRAIEQMVLNTTCQCNACANISALDLKFLVHYGTFSISPLRGSDELVGSAVIEIHRLLKNHITDATGIGAYTAYTAAAVEALGMDGFTTNLTRHTETYPDLDALALWIQDMHPVWERDREGTRFRVWQGDVLVQVQDELPVPLGVVWDLLLQPTYRSILFGLDRQEPRQRQEGRIAEGSVFTCYHGRSPETTQTVLDLQPLKRMVTEDTTPIPGARIFDEISLEPRGDSTLVTITCSRALSTTSSAASSWDPDSGEAWPPCARRSSARWPRARWRSLSPMTASHRRSKPQSFAASAPMAISGSQAR